MRTHILRQEWVALQGGLSLIPESAYETPEMPLNFLLEYRHVEKCDVRVATSIYDQDEDFRAKLVLEGKRYIKKEDWSNLRGLLDDFLGIADLLPKFPIEKIDRSRTGRDPNAPLTPWTHLYDDQQESVLEIMRKCIVEKDYMTLAFRVSEYPEMRARLPEFPHEKVDKVLKEYEHQILPWNASFWRTTHPKDKLKILDSCRYYLEQEKWLGLRFFLIMYPEIEEIIPELPMGVISQAHSPEWLEMRKHPLSPEECEELALASGELTDVQRQIMQEGFWDRGIRKTFPEARNSWEQEYAIDQQKSMEQLQKLRKQLGYI